MFVVVKLINKNKKSLQKKVQEKLLSHKDIATNLICERHFLHKVAKKPYASSSFVAYLRFFV